MLALMHKKIKAKFIFVPMDKACTIPFLWTEMAFVGDVQRREKGEQSQ